MMGDQMYLETKHNHPIIHFMSHSINRSLETPAEIRVKLGRNDKCYCGSAKKYKACCMNASASKYITGQINSSPKVIQMMEMFREMHPNHVFIDITDDMTSDQVYRDYQLHNIQSNIVMVAERREHNETVFASRIQDPEADIMFMFHGAYRTVYHGRIEYFKKSISNFIE